MWAVVHLWLRSVCGYTSSIPSRFSYPGIQAEDLSLKWAMYIPMTGDQTAKGRAGTWDASKSF